MIASPSSQAIYTASAIVAASLVAAFVWNKNKRNKVDRSWSYTSRAMAIGSFPPESEYPDPIINAVLLFDKCPAAEDIVEQIVSKMLQYDRLSAVYDHATRRGRPCENLDPHDLVREIQFEGSDKELFALVDQHMHHPLSEGVRGQVLPWWEWLILRNTTKGGPSAVVWRSHHALADGMSMVHIAEDIITDMEGKPVTNIIPQGMKKKFKQKRSLTNTAWALLQAVGAFAHMLTGPYDDETAFSQRTLVHSKKRSVVRFEPIPLEFVKDLKNAAGVSINDILYTCVSQAVHDYLLEQDDATLKKKGADLLCRTLMPIALPPSSGKKEKSTILRNKWCFLSADYAIGIDDIEDRLAQVHGALSKLKKSLLPVVIMTSQNYLAPLMPVKMGRQQVVDLMARHSTVFSNVPGPAMPCQLAGYEIQGAQMVFSNLVPQVGLLSYRGYIYGNFCLNPDDVVHSDRIPILMSRALVTLAERLKVDSVPSAIQSHAAAADKK